MALLKAGRSSGLRLLTQFLSAKDFFVHHANQVFRIFVDAKLVGVDDAAGQEDSVEIVRRNLLEPAIYLNTGYPFSGGSCPGWSRVRRDDQGVRTGGIERRAWFDQF
jgi:hypothetical protein